MSRIDYLCSELSKRVYEEKEAINSYDELLNILGSDKRNKKIVKPIKEIKADEEEHIEELSSSINYLLK